MKDWNKVFANAHLESSSPPSLCIQNRNPNPGTAGSRNTFQDDKKEILKAAELHGYKMLGTDKDAVVSFIKI